MPRRLVAINVVLAAVSVLCVALIVKQLAAVRPTPTPRGRPPVAARAEAPPAGESRPAPQAYNVIATRNLFSPTRTESAGPALASNAPALAAKPNLHGVVLREGSPIAYLEDPLTKRIAGYRIGDPIAGGTVQTISADAVVISRPDGMVDVRLRDPSKPRPAPPAAVGQPGQPGLPGPAGGQLPNQGQIPPRGFTPSGTPMVPGQAVPPPVIQPPMPSGPSTSLPFTRPSPSLGRRLPPISQGEGGQPQPAPTQ
jgi:hypothetical protein